MTKDRLEALLLLQCHREHCPTPDDVLSAFAQKAISQATQLRSVAETAEVVVFIV